MLLGKTKLELKVGIFVFLGLVILVVFVLSIGGFKTWSLGYKIRLGFNFINGVKLGAPVRFAGVDVGEVKDIKVITVPEAKPKVEVIAWIKRDVMIPVDSTVWVNTLGLLGEKYIEIMPGVNSKESVLTGQLLTGNEPIAMHEIAQLAKNLTCSINETVSKVNNGQGTVGKLLTDDSIYEELESLILDLKKHPWKLFWKTKEVSK